MSTLVIPDTCVLLDLVRAASLPRSHLNYVKKAVDLLERAETLSSGLRFVIPELIRQEYARNELAVVDSTWQTLHRDRDNYRRASETLAWLRAEEALPIADDQWIEEGIQRSQNLVARLFAIASWEHTEQDDMVRATSRVLAEVAPSRRGKESTADCVITEITLRLARDTQAVDANCQLLFVSSNVTDYCDKTGVLRSPLQNEFDAARIEYARNWGEAWGLASRQPA